jgi:hypothetical protein
VKTIYVQPPIKSRCGNNRTISPDRRALQTVKLLCDVDQAECLRFGVDAPSSTVKIDVDPESLTEEQRNFVADNLYDGLRFPSHKDGDICPPTYEGFIAAVTYGLEGAKIDNSAKNPDGTIDGGKLSKNDKAKKELRRKLILAAIKASAEKSKPGDIPF